MAKSTTTKEKTCAVTRHDWRTGSPKPAQVMEQISEEVLPKRKDFSTGSFGYHANDRIELVVNGKPVKAMVNLTVTIVNSAVAEEGGEEEKVESAAA